MTTYGRPIFVDTNVLVYATVASAPFHEQARQTLETLWEGEDDLWISRQVLREYAMVVSRPQSFMQPLDITATLKQLEALVVQFRIADDNATVTAEWFNLIQTIGASGKQVYDANIVATMLAFDITHLLTHNTIDFNRYQRLITLMPLVQG